MFVGCFELVTASQHMDSEGCPGVTLHLVHELGLFWDITSRSLPSREEQCEALPQFYYSIEENKHRPTQATRALDACRAWSLTQDHAVPLENSITRQENKAS